MNKEKEVTREDISNKLREIGEGQINKILKSQRKEIIDKIKEENLKGKSIHEIVDLIEND